MRLRTLLYSGRPWERIGKASLQRLFVVEAATCSLGRLRIDTGSIRVEALHQQPVQLLVSFSYREMGRAWKYASALTVHTQSPVSDFQLSMADSYWTTMSKF